MSKKHCQNDLGFSFLYSLACSNLNEYIFIKPCKKKVKNNRPKLLSKCLEKVSYLILPRDSRAEEPDLNTLERYFISNNSILPTSDLYSKCHKYVLIVHTSTDPFQRLREVTVAIKMAVYKT